MPKKNELTEILVRCEGGSFKAAHVIYDVLIFDDGELVARRPGKPQPATAADVDGFLQSAETVGEIARLVDQARADAEQIKHLQAEIAMREDEAGEAKDALNEALAKIESMQDELDDARIREGARRDAVRTSVDLGVRKPIDPEAAQAEDGPVQTHGLIAT